MRHTSFLLAVIVFLLLALSISSRAQWIQTNGPEGGIVYGFAVVGDHLFAAAEGAGVFRSTFDGQQWGPVNNGLTHLNLTTLIVKNGALFAGSYGGGAFRSTDAGGSWTPVNTGLTSLNVIRLAAAGANLFVATDIGVFLSTDNGQRWTLRSTGLGVATILGLTARGSTLFAGAYGEGVYRSTNNGQQWSTVNTNLSSLNVRSLGVDDTYLYAGTDNAGMFRSANDGATWEPVNSGLTDLNITSFAFDGNTLFVSTWNGKVFLSRNHGQVWAPAFNGLEHVKLWTLGFGGTNLFAGTHGNGIYRTTDYGQNWTPVNKGLIDVTVNALLIEGSNLFAGAWPGGIYFSSDKGGTWQQRRKGLTDTYIYSLIRHNGCLYAATYDSGVFISEDQGLNWLPINSGLTRLSVYCLAKCGSTLFAGTWGGGAFIHSDTDRSWTEVNTSLPSKFIISMAGNDHELYVGTTDKGIFYTNNNGLDWNERNTGLTDHTVYSLALSGADLYAGTWRGGVFHSKDGGQTWKQVNAGLTKADIRRLVAVQGNLFAATWGGGIFLSTNKGESWIDVDTGLPDSVIFTIAADKTDLYAGVKRGVWHRPLAEMITMIDPSLWVTHTGDIGPGSLRQALTDANEHTGPDTIRFAIPETDATYNDGVFTIHPSWELPRIMDGNLVIDGFSQAQFMGTDANPQGPEIEISGDVAGGVNGLWIEAPNVEIYGLTINRFNFAGLVIQKGDNGRISGCYIGTDARGEHPAGNGDNGILFYGDTEYYRIDPYQGTLPGNVISGNEGCGIKLNQTNSQIYISGNYIGLDRSGTAAIGNRYQGICIDGGCDANEINGNLIAGNGSEGIHISESHRNEISGNFIGANADFVPGLGNGTDGVYLFFSAENRLSNNFICYNGGDGVRLEGESAKHNRITQNSIWHNTNKGINTAFNANGGIKPPRLLEVRPEFVNGVTGPGNLVEIFTDDGGQGKVYLGFAIADVSGEFHFTTNGQALLSYFTATATDTSGNTSEFCQAVETAVQKTDATSPETFSLYPNYPNPFNPQTRIPFDVPATSRVRIRVYNILGDEIMELTDARMEAGHYEIGWTGSDATGVRLPSGIYIIKMSATDFEAVLKCVLLR